MRGKFEIIIKGLVSFLILMALLGIANILASYVSNPVYLGGVKLFNENIPLLSILAFIGILNEIFWNFSFPLNIPAPIISGILGLYIFDFVFKFFKFIETFTISGIEIPVFEIKFIMFICIIISGYVVIYARYEKPLSSMERDLEKEMKQKSTKIQDKKTYKAELPKTIKKNGEKK